MNDNAKLTYNSYSFYGFIIDLIKQLYCDDIYPWYDTKYNKKINRLMLLVLLYLNKKYVNVDEFSKNFVSYLKNVLVYSEFCKMTFKNYDNVSTNLKNEPVVDTLLTCIEKLKQIIMSKDKATELSTNTTHYHKMIESMTTILQTYVPEKINYIKN